MHEYKHDMTGERFGRLTVTTYAGKAPNGHTLWECKCSCGAFVTVSRSNLISGRQVSCGCKRREQAGMINQTHGGRNSRLYSIWCNMITRTTNPKGTAYHRYGGRGVKMCEEWRNNFEAFRDWALANGYTEELTIDRIDNDGGYEPDNCRWVPWSEQFNHRSNTKLITYHGETLSISQWAEKLNISKTMLYQRIKAGWPVERALTEGVTP